MYFKTFVLISLMLIVHSLGYSQQSFFGGSENDIPSSIVRAGDGSLYMAGYSKSFDSGDDQVYIIKCTETGDVIWENTYGGIYGEHPFDLIINDDNHLVLTGESYTGFGQNWGRENQFVIEVAGNGELVSQNAYFLFHRDIGLRVKKVSGGGYILNGFSKSSDDVHGEMMVTRLSSSYEILWQVFIGEEQSVDYGFEIIQNSLGFLAIGSQGGFLNSNQVDFTTPQSDILVAQLDFDGNLLWKKTYGGSGHDWVEEAILVNDEIFLVGSTQSIGEGGFDMLLMKLSINGDSLFSKAYGSEYYDQGRCISYANGSLYLGGVTKKSNHAFSSANYIVSTDLDGELIWENTYEFSDSDKLKDMAIDDGNSQLYCISAMKDDTLNSGFHLYSVNSEGQISNIKTFTKNSLTIYPNPVHSGKNIIVKLPNTNALSGSVYVYNLSGELVWNNQIETDKSECSISTKGMAAGLYTCKILYENDQVYIGKFIVY